MTLNCSTHGDALQKAFDRVVAAKTGDRWVIFDYEGNSNVLKVGEEGDDGLEELSTSFNSGRLQFGIISVRLSPTVHPKVVLIHWQGDGVQTMRLASTTAHAEDLRRFLKAVHVVVHARNDSDVEPDAIQTAVAKLPAANAAQNVESTYATPEKVSSVYQPVRPHIDVNTKARDEFWNKMNDEERHRVQDERAASVDQQQRYDAERRQLADDLHKKLEVADAKAAATSVSSTTTRPFQPIGTGAAVSRPDNAAGPGKGRLIGNRLNMFEKKDEKPIVPSSLGRPSGATSTSSSTKKWPPVTTGHPAPPKSPNTPSPTPPPEFAAPTSPAILPGNVFAKANAFKDANANTYIPPLPSELEPPSPPPTPKQTTKWAPVSSPAKFDAYEEPPMEPPPAIPTQIHQSPAKPFGGYDAYEEPPSEPQPPPAFQSQYDVPPPEPFSVKTSAPPMISSQYDLPPTVDTNTGGLRALALWDYQAGDETEITFDPDQIITDVEQVDDGWWRGRAPNGSVGLFPANYVKILD